MIDRSKLTPGDWLVVGLLVVFLILGIAVRGAVNGLGDMGQGIKDTGEQLRISGKATAKQISDAFGAAGDAAGALPVLGSGLADELRKTGAANATALQTQAVATGNELVASGQSGIDNARRIAWLSGLLVFLVPSVLLLAIVLPRRLPELRGSPDA